MKSLMGLIVSTACLFTGLFGGCAKPTAPAHEPSANRRSLDAATDAGASLPEPQQDPAVYSRRDLPATRPELPPTTKGEGNKTHGFGGGGIAHYAREIKLTRDEPRDAQRGIRLVRVEPDGTAVIYVEDTGETLSAKPGDYFLGAYRPPYNVRTFGERGMHLSETDADAQTAVMVQRWAKQF